MKKSNTDFSFDITTENYPNGGKKYLEPYQLDLYLNDEPMKLIGLSCRAVFGCKDYVLKIDWPEERGLTESELRFQSRHEYDNYCSIKKKDRKHLAAAYETGTIFIAGKWRDYIIQERIRGTLAVDLPDIDDNPEFIRFLGVLSDMGIQDGHDENVILRKKKSHNGEFSKWVCVDYGV